MPYIQDPTAEGIRAVQQGFSQGYGLARQANQDKQAQEQHAKQMEMMAQQLELLTNQNKQAQLKLAQQDIINAGDAIIARGENVDQLNKVVSGNPVLKNKFNTFIPLNPEDEIQQKALMTSMQISGDKRTDPKLAAADYYMSMTKDGQFFAVPKQAVLAPYYKNKKAEDTGKTSLKILSGATSPFLNPSHSSPVSLTDVLSSRAGDAFQPGNRSLEKSAVKAKLSRTNTVTPR